MSNPSNALPRPVVLAAAYAMLLCGSTLWADTTAASNAGKQADAGLSAAELGEAARLSSGVTIYRDAYGIPHIHGQTDEHVIFGFAFAQAEDYFWQIEDTYILSLGRYSEVHGHHGLNSDLLNRAFEIVPQSRATFSRLEPHVQSIYTAFALGLNYYLAKHPETRPRLITHFEPWHMLAYGRQVMLELCFRYTRLSHNYLPRSHDLIWTASGSNGWAIAPSKTKSGHAMLFVNPHLPWFGFGQMYEVHLRSDEGWVFSGATMFGSCVPTLGHNEHLGWTFTTNEPDIADLWRVTFDDPGHPLRYRTADGFREATEWEETIKIKSGNEIKSRVVQLRKTHHGPIVVKQDDQHCLAARISGLDNSLMLRQQLELVKARNFAEFKHGLELQQFPIMNVIYADQAGNIYYLYNGMIPRRDPQFNWSLPVDASDPRTEWKGLHKLEELPQLLNPASGYVQNCNSSPFTTCDDGNCERGRFPPYMVEDRDDDKRRAKVSRQLLREMKSVTFEEVQQAAFDTTVYWAQQELPNYSSRFELLRKSDPALASRVEPYLQHLLDWDCHISAESTQATLCEAWYEELYGMSYPAETLLPKYVKEPQLEFEALATAAEKLASRHGDWRVPWASLFRIQRRPYMVDLFELPFDDRLPSLPSLGAPGPMGVVFTQYCSPSIRIPFVVDLKKRYGLVGASYIAVYEFGPRVRGASALNFGESGDPTSPHFFDQAQLLSDRKLKPELFDWSDVLAGAKFVYHPGEPPLPPAAR
ncbi:MAG: penicillin acylase family protein [Planctomycetia bacterium]|nr:penicillin acylase family protein [Planctomycetia bacterium]